MRIDCLLGLGLCFFTACGAAGGRGSPPPSSPPPSSTEGAKVAGVQKSAGQPSYASESPPPADYAAPPPPAPSPAAPSVDRSEEHAEAPGTTDARARYSRANVQLSQSRRELEIATSQRDCANACRALDSMERAAAQICELARSNDEHRTCKSAEDQVGAARDRVHSACGDCPKKAK